MGAAQTEAFNHITSETQHSPLSERWLLFCLKGRRLAGRRLKSTREMEFPSRYLCRHQKTTDRQTRHQPKTKHRLFMARVLCMT